MPVPYQLASLGAGVGETQTVYYVIQSPFQPYQEIFTSNTRLSLCLGESFMELPLQNSISIAGFLLLSELQGTVGEPPSPPPGLLPRRFRSLVKGTLGCKTAAALNKELLTTATTQTTDGSCISCHNFPLLDSSPLRRATAGMRDRRHIPDSDDIKARTLQRTNSRLAATARALDIYLYLPQAVYHGFPGGIASRHLGRIRRAFA
jgi:hypothetical protein